MCLPVFGAVAQGQPPVSDAGEPDIRVRTLSPLVNGERARLVEILAISGIPVESPRLRFRCDWPKAGLVGKETHLFSVLAIWAARYLTTAS